MNSQAAYAMITQMSPLFQAMSLPVHPRRERDSGKGEQEHAEIDPHVHGGGGETRCETCVPLLQVLLDDGGPEGGASPARAVMTLPWPAARQAGRAGRCTGGGEAALSSGR